MRKLAVCALIFNDENKVLCVSRKDNQIDFGLPGGKVDPGELPIEAIKRELKEETGLDMINAYEIFTDIDGEFECTTFLCKVKPGIPSSVESGMIAYKDWDSLFQGSFGEYNRKLYLTVKSL